MEILDRYGSITKGKAACVCISEPMPSFEFLSYSFGSHLIKKVILNGKVIR